MRIRTIGTAATLVLAASALTLAARTSSSPAALGAQGPDLAADDAAVAAAPVSSRSPSAAPASDCVQRVSDRYEIDRVAGDDRFATAACAAALGYPDGAPTVLIARGDAAGSYADALAGTVLADALQAPILLTRPDVLPDATADALQQLGAEHVVLLGGITAISRQVENQVEALVPGGADAVERLAGEGRAETAVLIAERAGTHSRAYVVNGHRPADALVAGAVAARDDAALLLVDDAGVPDVTRDALDGVDRLTIVGGFGVVNAAVEAQLRDAAPGAIVERLAGGSRDETAASVARARPSDGPIHLAGGADARLVDAIAAGWLAAARGGPVLYSLDPHPGRGTDRYLRLGGLNGAPAIALLGGELALPADVVPALEQRLDEAADGGPAPQVRAFWVHLFDSSVKSREGINQVLDAAAAANLNTVIVQVARRHDAYYTSNVLPRTPDPAMPPDLDLLGELVPAAHARGLDVHAWFAIAPIYHSGAYGDLQMPPDHVYVQHGPGAPESERWVTRAEDGTWSSTYLDVGVPEVQDHVVAMIEEVAQRYDVDAVHLDYLRYPEGGRWGYNPKARSAWQADGSPDFSDWRRAQTRKLASRIHDAVQAARPGTKVSMAAIAQGDGPAGAGGWGRTRAYSQVYQDWAGWLQDGIVDEAFPMAYMREDGVSPGCEWPDCRHAVWYDHWVEFAAQLRPGPGTIAIGQAGFLNTVANSAKQVDEALANSDGLVVYSYQQDTKDPDTEPQGSLLAHLVAGPFADPAPAP